MTKSEPREILDHLPKASASQGLLKSLLGLFHEFDRQLLGNRDAPHANPGTKFLSRMK